MADFIHFLLLVGQADGRNRNFDYENPVSLPSSRSLRVANTCTDDEIKKEKDSYYVSCIANNDHLFDRGSMEEEQINKFYKGTQLDSRISGFVEDRFNIDPIAWGQQGQGQAYPGFGPSVCAANMEHLPISIDTQCKKIPSTSEKDIFRAHINDVHSSRPTQNFLSTYNHDYWPKPAIPPKENQEVFHGKSLGGYSKPNLFRLGNDWNWKWIPSGLDSSSMHLGPPLTSQRNEYDLKEGVSQVSGWAKVLNSTRTHKFNPFDRSDGPLEPNKHNPFPILMSGHRRMLHKNILSNSQSKDGLRKNF